MDYRENGRKNVYTRDVVSVSKARLYAKNNKARLLVKSRPIAGISFL
jgi:hypothetical protein